MQDSGSFGKLPLLNIHDVNTYCLYEQGYHDFVNKVWSHEQLHMTVAQNEAGKPENDVHALLEPLVGSPNEDMGGVAATIIKETELRIRRAALDTHSGNSPLEYWFYVYSNSQWARSNIKLYD